MLELSIPIRFALMFALLMVANKEYRRLGDINKKTWGEIAIATITMAFCCFVAGGMLFESLVEILTLHMSTG